LLRLGPRTPPTAMHPPPLLHPLIQVQGGESALRLVDGAPTREVSVLSLLLTNAQGQVGRPCGQARRPAGLPTGDPGAAAHLRVNRASTFVMGNKLNKSPSL
jgi:hypothetical protein